MKEIIEKCIRRGNFKLHSGQTSDILFDVMLLINDGSFLCEWETFFDYDDRVIGIEFGGAVLAMLANVSSAAIIRKDGTIYGEIKPNYILVDDAITTENSIRRAIDCIGYPPKTIKCVVDRREKESDLPIKSLYKYKESDFK